MQSSAEMMIIERSASQHKNYLCVNEISPAGSTDHHHKKLDYTDVGLEGTSYFSVVHPGIVPLALVNNACLDSSASTDLAICFQSIVLDFSLWSEFIQVLTSFTAVLYTNSQCLEIHITEIVSIGNAIHVFYVPLHC